MTRTRCPGCTFPWSRTARRAVVPDTGSAAACGKVRLAGFGTSLSGPVTASSANEPSAVPITSSPGSTSVTFAPTASTVPATSHPRTRIFGRRNPIASRAMYGIPVIRCHTSGPQPAACTRTSTSFSPIAGSSMSRNSSTSAEPYVSCAIAFIEDSSRLIDPSFRATRSWTSAGVRRTLSTADPRCTAYTCQAG